MISSTNWDNRFNFCPGKFVYNLSDFHWDKETKTLVANECNLFPIRNSPNNICFPNNGRQFYIANHKTKQFRRFILKRETDKYYYFKFDKDMLCSALHCEIRKQTIELIQRRIKLKKKRIFKFSTKKLKKWKRKTRHISTRSIDQ